MSKRVIRKPAAYFLIVFSLLVLAVALLSLVQGVMFYNQGQMPRAVLSLVMSAIGIGLSLSTITQIRRVMRTAQLAHRTVFSTIACENCPTTILRTFVAGDFISKEVGLCQKCGGSMRVTSIYTP